MKSMNVCAMAIAVMKVIRKINGTALRIVAESETMKIPTRLIWIPGIRPVIVPARTPIKRERISGINI